MSDPRAVGTGLLLTRTFALIRSGWLRNLAAYALLLAAGLALDAQVVGDAYAIQAELLLILVTLPIHYWVLRAALADCGLALAPHTRFAAFAGLMLLTMAATVVGFFLFIVPGILLTVRWWTIGPILLTSERAGMAALGQGWRETGPHGWAIFGALLIIWLPISVLSISSFVALHFSAPMVMATINVAAFSAGSVLNWNMAAAIFALTRRPERLDDIFA